VNGVTAWKGRHLRALAVLAVALAASSAEIAVGAGGAAGLVAAYTVITIVCSFALEGAVIVAGYAIYATGYVIVAVIRAVASVLWGLAARGKTALAWSQPSIEADHAPVCIRWRLMLVVAAHLMPPTAGQRWLREIASVTFEASDEQWSKAARSYVRSAPETVVVAWAVELSRRARAGQSAAGRRERG
jgi:hypothetical protein